MRDNEWNEEEEEEEAKTEEETSSETHLVPKIHDCLFARKGNGRQTLISL